MKKNRNNMGQWYKDLSFRKKLLTLSLGVCMIPIFVFQIISMNISISYLNGQVNELVYSNLNQISEKFSLTLESYTDIVYQIYADETLVKSLESYHDAGTTERASIYFNSNERIKQFAETKKEIRSISLICNTGESITYDNQTGSSIDNIWRDYTDLREIAPYQQTEGKREIVLIPTQIVEDQGSETALFFLGKELYNTENLEKGAVATVIVSIDEAVLEDICNGEEELPVKGSMNFIVDENGEIISYPQKEYIGTRLEENQTVCEFVHQTGLVSGWNMDSISYEDTNTGWTFYNVYNQDYMLSDVRKVQMVYWMLLLADLVLVVFFIDNTSRYFTSYLDKLMLGIKQVESGDFDVQLEVDREDEFGKIGRNFNEMTQEIKTLIHTVSEISEKKNQAEIKALESQINPHFLYNTLDAINWMAIGKEEYEISEMIGNLGFILRYTMNQSNEMVPIAEVEEWLSSYVSLYQLRFQHSFEFKIYVEPEVRSVKIYKLLLQPILENAILHGVRDMEGGLVSVDIDYTEDEEKIHLLVEDNGVGMERVKVERYNDRRRIPEPGERIGLANVFERIQLYYGEAGSWHISSKKGMGTIVELVIPLR